MLQLPTFSVAQVMSEGLFEEAEPNAESKGNTRRKTVLTNLPSRLLDKPFGKEKRPRLPLCKGPETTPRIQIDTAGGPSRMTKEMASDIWTSDPNEKVRGLGKVVGNAFGWKQELSNAAPGGLLVDFEQHFVSWPFVLEAVTT